MMPGAAVRGEPASLRASAWRHVAFAFVATALAAVALRALAGFGADFVVLALVVAAIGGALILHDLPRSHPHPAFGPANAVTLARAVPTALVAALAVEPGTVAAATFATVAGTAVVVLDGFDGRLARRHGVASAFGARFDMETDALLVLALAVLAWRWDRAGAWVVLSGLARYLFVGAAVLAPWLRRPLPPSRRRQTVCVVQIVVLLAVVAPLLPRAVTAPLALAGLLVLAYSFAVDVAWLARRAGRPMDEGPSA
jgi:phosphatidylglycerophosphate synthase